MVLSPLVAFFFQLSTWHDKPWFYAGLVLCVCEALGYLFTYWEGGADLQMWGFDRWSGLFTTLLLNKCQSGSCALLCGTVDTGFHLCIMRGVEVGTSCTLSVAQTMLCTIYFWHKASLAVCTIICWKTWINWLASLKGWHKQKPCIVI